MSKLLTGRVLKNYNGYYYVYELESSVTYTCKVKGKMKKNRFSLATGDLVELEVGEKQEGMITAVLPRKNYIPRPTMANLDLFVATFACVTPDFSYLIADKLLALAEEAKLPTIIVLNKIDLAAPELVEEIKGTYERIGYEVYPISTRKGLGIDALKERLRGKICALGGPSGVGKSSALNALDPHVELKTGNVSEKIGRGKHTTRFAELLPFGEGFIADTPGFGNILIEGLTKEALPYWFREFEAFEQGCRFAPCSHTHEPICGIKKAVAQGELAKTRYESYVTILEEIKLLEEKEGKK